MVYTMEYGKIIRIGDAIGILATIFLIAKVMLITPMCFSVFDAYFTLLPIVFTKLVDIIALFSFKEKNEAANHRKLRYSPKQRKR